MKRRTIELGANKENNKAAIYLGRYGENNTMQICFNTGPWAAEFGPGVLHCYYKPEGAAEAREIALEATESGGRWVLKEEDLQAVGDGELQFYYAARGACISSPIYNTITSESLTYKSK